MSGEDQKEMLKMGDEIAATSQKPRIMDRSRLCQQMENDTPNGSERPREAQRSPERAPLNCGEALEHSLRT